MQDELTELDDHADDEEEATGITQQVEEAQRESRGRWKRRKRSNKTEELEERLSSSHLLSPFS